MIFFLLFTLPFIVALAVEYAACRFPKRRLWRWLPPAAALLLAAAVALSRYHGWSPGEKKAPWETLILIPGLPALGAFAGLWLGWRLWKWLWLPRVVKDRK